MAETQAGLLALIALPKGAALVNVLTGIGDKAIAVSGGVDSMTLAVVAHRADPERTTVCHAVSPAVPPEATDRVRQYAVREGWKLVVIDAGEFDDQRYLANPLDRCFYCKTDLYGAIATRRAGTLMSGTNLDDLGDFRPGLKAAAAHGVVHPFVEAGFAKVDVRAAAAALGLDDIKALPAMPCLASRIETGIAVSPDLVRGVHAAERLVGAAVTADTVRCRVAHDGIRIELDDDALARLSTSRRTMLSNKVRNVFSATDAADTVTFAAYRRGSAFLGKPGDD
ncbi:MAG: adenine nucleotide alpha hydrolase [Pseudomonadota bacterium]